MAAFLFIEVDDNTKSATFNDFRSPCASCVL